MADAQPPNATAPPEAGDTRLTTPIAGLPGVSRRRAGLFQRLGIRQVSHLIRHLPMRYEHESAEGAIEDLPPDAVGSARGEIASARHVPGRGYGKKGRFEATLEDDTGTLRLVWFNAGYLRHKLHPGMTLRVQGKTKDFGGYPQIANPKFEILGPPPEGEAGEGEGEGEHEPVAARAEKLRPIYPATDGLPSSVIEQTIADVLPGVLDQLTDPLPPGLTEHHAMPTLTQAFQWAHAPEDREQAKSARRRLAFNELLLLQLGIAMRRAYVERRLVAPVLTHHDAIDKHIRERFPFELTQGQDAVVKQIAEDLGRSRPMNRLVQGDVGSGKTVVALYAMLLAVADRKQAALMAPTELLAEQHFASISRMLKGTNIRLCLLTGGQSTSGSRQRQETLDAIAAGEFDIVVGTHALVGEAVRFRELAVAVVDEQHRFGVQQRAKFRTAAPPEASPRTDPDNAEEDGRSRVPHQLVMTATPIPRTLSLTVFGDLDVSTIHGLPPGRTPITNRAVGHDTAEEVYRYLRTRLQRGEQGYVVVPAIDPTAGDTDKAVKTVNEHAKLLQDKYLQGYKVATVHGRLKRDTRERTMNKFRENKVQVLVATTVIEVGVDVPGATVMIVEHAERFGLAQLHQLRGRIGRGASGVRPLCVFITDPTTDDGHKRIDAIASTNDGFRIAELDLEIRGMGDFFGTRQSGMPPLRVARIPEDLDLLQLARRDAQGIIDGDPALESEPHAGLRKVLLQQYGQALGLIDVG